MDEQLVALLDSQDWEEIIGKLTLAALNQLKLCGLSTDKDGVAYSPSANHPQGYALDAMTKAYEGCHNGRNCWDPDRGDLYPFLEHLARRLVVDNYKKYRTRGPTISYEQMTAEVEVEEATGELLNALFDAADDGIQELILVLQDHVGHDGAVNWSEIRTKLTNAEGKPGVSKHELSNRRAKLEELFKKHDLYNPIETVT